VALTVLDHFDRQPPKPDLANLLAFRPVAPGAQLEGHRDGPVFRFQAWGPALVTSSSGSFLHLPRSGGRSAWTPASRRRGASARTGVGKGKEASPARMPIPASSATRRRAGAKNR
jgi:hypothetical protein